MQTFTGLLALLFAASAFAQLDVPLPPKPAEDGPGLEVTLKFIQDKVREEGVVGYTAFVTETSQPLVEWSNKFQVEASNFVADTKTCQLTFHWNATVSGSESDNRDYTVNPKEIREVVVMPQEQKQIDTRAGHAIWNSRTLFLDVATPDERVCSLTAGNVLRMETTPTGGSPTADVRVISSHKGDCPVGMVVRVSMPDLQTMQNTPRAEVDSGLDMLHSNQGRGGLTPALESAMGATQPSIFGNAPTDPNVEAVPEQQQQDAKRTETPATQGTFLADTTKELF